MQNQTIKLSDFLAEEIRMRYATSSILPYSDNELVHRLFKNHMSVDEAKKVNLMNANLFRMSHQIVKNVKGEDLHLNKSLEDPVTQHLLDELGLRPTKEDFQKIRDKNIKLCVVGYGGAMINMLYNMYTWSMELSETRIFDKLLIFEKDNLDFSNIPRIGKPVVFNYYPDSSRKFEENVPNIKTLLKINLVDMEKELSKERVANLVGTWLDEEYADFVAKKGYVFVGAPTLETRHVLADKKFFFLGHSDYEVDITFAPQNISSLAVETYGTIDIPVLLINIQLATAAFIKILANNDINSLEKDAHLLEFDLKKWIDENPETVKELYNV